MKRVVAKTKFVLMALVVAMMMFTLTAQNGRFYLFTPIIVSAQIQSTPMLPTTSFFQPAEGEYLAEYVFSILEFIHDVDKMLENSIYQLANILNLINEVNEVNEVNEDDNTLELMFTWLAVLETIYDPLFDAIFFLLDTMLDAPRFLWQAHDYLLEALDEILDYSLDVSFAIWDILLWDVASSVIDSDLNSFYNAISEFEEGMIFGRAYWQIATLTFRHATRHIIQPDPALVGTWAWDGEMEWTYVLNANGTGTRGMPDDYEEILWRTAYGILWIDRGIDDNFIRFEHWDYTIVDGLLTLTSRQISGLSYSYILQDY